MDTEEIAGAQSAGTTEPSEYTLYSETQAQEASEPNTETPPQAKTETDKPEETSEQAEKRLTGSQRAKYKLDQERAKTAELEARLAKLEGSTKTQEAGDTNSEPTEDKFDNVMDFLKAHNKWSADQALNTYKTEQQQIAENQKFEQKIQKHDEREIEYAATVPDYQEKVDAIIDSGVISPELSRAVLDYDSSPQMAYHLATHPQDLFQVINAKGPALKLALDMLDAHFKSAPVKAAVRQTSATAPITPVKTGSTTKKDISDDLPYEEWIKVRESQLRR